MKFEYKHTFDVDIDTLIASMFHPELPPVLVSKMTTVKDIEVLERQETAERLTRRVRYLPVPSIKKIGPKTITPESMQWVEESSLDKGRKVMTFDNIPTHPKVREKMTNSGTVEFRSLGPGRSERVMSGELKVKFPILGRIAEGIIAKTAEKILDEEAKVLAEWMRERK
jgi:hypothetical protein